MTGLSYVSIKSKYQHKACSILINNAGPYVDFGYLPQLCYL
jgi:hypothetical protein